MKRPLSTSTHQFRTALIRKLKNMVPNHTPEFIETNSGICFILKNAQGEICSGNINVGRNTGNALTTQNLRRCFKRAGFIYPPEV